MKKFIRIFKEKSGYSFIIKCLKLGYLPYCLGHVLINGVSTKSLELLRNGVTIKLHNRITRRYKYILDLFDKCSQNDIRPEFPSNKVWFCWFQGIENAPEVVKLCYQSVCRAFPDKDIVLLDETNMFSYVSFPDYILQKYRNGNITRTHFSDLLRIALLAKYGGTWIDSTVFISQECTIPRYMTESPFFVFQNFKPGSNGSVINCSSWYISSYANNHIILAIREVLWKYWEENDNLVDYYLIHHVMMMVASRYESEWDKIIKFPNSLPHVLYFSLFKPYDSKTLSAILTTCPMHKLTYKLPSGINYSGSNYEFLMRSLN